MAKTQVGPAGLGNASAPDEQGEGGGRAAFRRTRMRRCPDCERLFVEEIRYCPQDGAALQVAPDAEVPCDETDPYVGEILADRYRVEHRIGEGGMGVVYQAEHVLIGRKVALKILRASFVEREDVVARFQREAQSASLIGHDNIVEVIDFGKLADGGIYIAMELLRGRDLADVIELETPLRLDPIMPVVEQVCDALHAAHEKGIVHRDLKPENVFLQTKGSGDGAKEVVKLLDFGIAKFTGADNTDGSRLTQTGSVFGTPEYMAPEQAAGKQVDGRADQYAFGVILYELLTGDVPFHAETFMGVLSKHLFEQPLPPRSFRPDLRIPVAIENVILRMMEKDRADRFPTMGAAAQALRTALAVGRAAAEAPPGGDTSEESVSPRVDAGAGPATRQPPSYSTRPSAVVAREVELLEDLGGSRGRGWLTIVLVALFVLTGLGLLYLGLNPG